LKILFFARKLYYALQKFYNQTKLGLISVFVYMQLFDCYIVFTILISLSIFSFCAFKVSKIFCCANQLNL